MKKLIVLLGLCFVAISAVMIYLVVNGISLRSAPIIRPSIMTPDQRNVAEAVVQRLFPDFQNASFTVIGLRPEVTDSQRLLTMLKEEYEKLFKTPVNILPDAEAASAEDFKKCAMPCWILTTQDKSNELSPHPMVEKFLSEDPSRVHFNLTLIPFTPDVVVTDACLQEKRLTLDCLVPLSIHEAKRKMTDPKARYFFVRKYNEKDYFLFTQEEVSR